MARRLPSQPPVLPGFSHVHILGSGGFADVFLYEQNMPRRQVAVKVMLSEIVNDQVRQMFQAEANLMAQLSAHPSILTVYQAGVSADGRPYLVMELCSPSLSERYRRERIPVPDILQIAVRIGSAVETAHRAGVLHRDIKPSNILLTAYGHPVLSDFGIASTLSESDHREAVGMSIPWSAPEVLMDETSGSVASEVWSLAATVYSLLAGRSPFEVPGESNKSTDLIGRINRAKVQPIGRSDVPESLEHLLRKAMSRKPDGRPSSAMEFVRGLQAIESELGVPQTPVEVAVDDWALATVGDLGDRTRIRGVAGANQHAASRLRKRRRLAQNDYAPVGTVLRETEQSQPSANTKSTSRGKGMQVLAWSLVVSAVLVIALGAVATIVLIRSNSDRIPKVTDIQSRQSIDSIEFSWADPGLLPGDSYQISTNQGTSSSIQQSTTFSVDANPGDHVCITVTVNREGKTGDPSGEKCVEFGG
ncbi:serine/threonine protein kinase [Cryobacterium mesophilum]|uniref:non-specific serine/threonine protein kinase n=1 Tax=Terrimesophilobacter mesophilus TaxID=433647 RepID=A0A4R8VCS8_9MICO|nr:protein kinase [Terrimesophilobacter mesophilus]MBB5633996.1 serine/threonine protein kinase [Terrimesophilobacter mesophilus]TFB80653.1 serine/threonine protein kinase [Terrimesophilobacter mesophilus]